VFGHVTPDHARRARPPPYYVPVDPYPRARTRTHAHAGRRTRLLASSFVVPGDDWSIVFPRHRSKTIPPDGPGTRRARGGARVEWSD